MKKMIHVRELRLGMYVDKLDGNWLDHPFWKSAFNLIEQKDLDAILSCSITHVWIDTSKGLDIEEQEKLAKKEHSPEPALVSDPAPEKQVSLEEEMEHARQTLAKAKEATVSMFQEARMGKSIQAEDAAPLVEEITESVARNPGAMLSLTRMKTADDYTYLHSVAVCALMIALGKQLKYEGDFQSLGMAGLLHDVGKMAIPEDVLNKPGKLTDEEFAIVQAHPVRGWEMLKEGGGVDDIALEVCLHHHEKVDGSGYPDKLSDKDISLVAKMGAVCDVYDAITSDRCYKKGWEPGEALKKMAQWKDGHFDDQIFNSFVKSVGIYPTGTLVKLQSGRLAVITDQNSETLLKPKLKVFYSTSSRSHIPAKEIDLARSSEEIEAVEDPADWDLTRKQLMETCGLLP